MPYQEVALYLLDGNVGQKDPQGVYRVPGEVEHQRRDRRDHGTN